MADLTDFIRDVPDFPKPGILFKDITPLLGDVGALSQAADEMSRPFASRGVQYVAGIESRGFIFGSMIAERLGAGFVPIRKPGKLPAEHRSKSYELEYGTNTLEVHVDAVTPGAQVLVVDDLVATGGTIVAACELIREIGGEVIGLSCLLELTFLNPRQLLGDLEMVSLIPVDGD